MPAFRLAFEGDAVSDVWRPPGVEEQYRSLLRAVSASGLPSDIRLTSHWPLLGTAPRRLLIVGQAVFGWIPNWSIADVATEAGITRVVTDTQSACYERSDPMNWILENRARSSPFWRATRHLVESTFPGSTYDWYSHVAWANIYPVARNDVKGNPEGVLRESQTTPAARLLDAVASAARPRPW